MTSQLVKSLGKTIAALGFLVAAGACALAGVDASNVRASVLLGALGVGLAAFAFELVADAAAPDVDGTREWADRLGSIVVGIGFVVIGATIASMAVMPASGTTVAARALVAAIGIAIAGAGLAWLGNIGDDDAGDEDVESETTASAEVSL